MPAVSDPVQPSRSRAPRRGPLRRYLETRGLLGRHRAPHVHTSLLAADGTRLAGTYLAGPSAAAPAIVLLHGFAAHRRKPAYAHLADVLSRYAHVLAIDHRGHGQSGGASTLGDLEALDAAAAVAWLHRYGHSWVGIVGASMGATAALHAAAEHVDVDAVVTVSAPARLGSPGKSEAMQRLDDAWRTPWKRWIMRVFFGVRVVEPAGWNSPPHPVDAAARLRVPLLVVHGCDDHFFPVADAEALAAAGDGTLWREPAGFGHAEDGVTTAFAEALGCALQMVRLEGRFPDRDAARACRPAAAPPPAGTGPLEEPA